MFRPSGEISGSAAHRRSNTSMGLRADFTGCAWIVVARSSSNRAIRLGMESLFAGNPAVTLMFIDHAHRLHKRVADGAADELEAFVFQIFAHRVAARGRRRDIAQVERPAAQHLTVGKLPEIVAERSVRGA